MQPADVLCDISPDVVWVDGYRRLSPTAGISLGMFQILTLVAEELEVTPDGMCFNDLADATEVDGDDFLEAMEGLTEPVSEDGSPLAPLLNVYRMDDGELRFTLTDQAWNLLRRTTH